MTQQDYKILCGGRKLRSHPYVSTAARYKLSNMRRLSRFSEVFLGPRTNAELVSKFHVALHASHAALPMVTN
jgi:hypothetical protein